jgi:hypothetical protein
MEREGAAYWIARSSRAMTAVIVAGMSSNDDRWLFENLIRALIIRQRVARMRPMTGSGG